MDNSADVIWGDARESESQREHILGVTYGTT